ncbi:DOMON domain protein [Oesophagostomum dentatum]|uniref:DOMON domain protein n=1 Tax=Oesophagostomum dentatum TaxID=61180 RepID=A0A0B1T301_OESDE|nr:DOMON domain protein [Oesophagostomum dentatum]
MFRVLLSAFLVSSVASQCSYNAGDLSARWQVVDDKLTVEFINKKIGNNKWTGIGFGATMADLEVVLVKVEDNKPTAVTGHTSGYEAPTLDKSANVSPQLLSLNNNQLTFRFTRPLSANGDRKHSLEECQNWSFVKEGLLNGDEIAPHTSLPFVKKICPDKCKDIVL